MCLAITYMTGCFETTGYCDASWGYNPDNGTPTFGYLFMLVGGPLSFKTALQNVTAQSTPKAEGISMALASKRGCMSLQHDDQAGIWKAVQQSTTLWLQHRGPTHRTKSHLQLAHETHRSTFFLLEGASQGRENHHPPRGDTETTGRRRD